MFALVDSLRLLSPWPLANALSDYGDELWAEFTRWFLRMGPSEYLVLAGMSVVLGFMLLFSTGVKR